MRPFSLYILWTNLLKSLSVIPILFLYLFIGGQHNFHIIRNSCHLRVTWKASLVEQELLPFQITRVHPWFLIGVCVAQSLVFWVVFYRLLFVFFSSFFLPLYYLSFKLWLLIVPLVSSNFLKTFYFSYYMYRTRSSFRWGFLFVDCQEVSRFRSWRHIYKCFSCN